MNKMYESVAINQPLQELKAEDAVQFQSFSDEVLAVLKEKSIEVATELVASRCNKDTGQLSS